jgi:hypothetical protein
MSLSEVTEELLTLNLSSPMGGAAYGIPLKEQKGFPFRDFSVEPFAGPNFVST